MAPATNWMSFTLPPVEMLLRPCGYEPAYPFSYLGSSASSCSHEDAIGYGIHFPPVKLEDLLLRSPPVIGPSSEILALAQESSSMTTARDLHHHDRHSTKESCDPPADVAIALAGNNSAGSEVVDSAPEACQALALSCLSPDSRSHRPRAGAAPARRGPATTTTASPRTSVYRGVTRHRWTGRYEAHLWDNTCCREGQKRKGRQVYLGGYDKEEKAARAYDLAALKYWGSSATTNFPVDNYTREIEEMMDMTKQEFIASLRRKSSGFSRGASIYRGVTRHHQHGRWQARIGRVAGNKDLYLGTFATEEEAAEAYDVAAIKFRGVNAVTNFELTRYDVEAIANTDLPIGASAKRIKQALQASSNSNTQLTADSSTLSQPSNDASSALLHSLLQLRTTSGPSCSLAYNDCSLGRADLDLCHQGFYRLPANDQNDNQRGFSQWADSGFLQLTTYLAPPQ